MDMVRNMVIKTSAVEKGINENETIIISQFYFHQII
jgi:hypothetical protein